MRAISIHQPWAELILRGQKTIEIRRWTNLYRGDLYLHASKEADEYKPMEKDTPSLFRGGYVGVMELSAILPFTPESWDLWRKKHLSSGPYNAGLYAWIIRKPRRFAAPIPGPGHQGLFRPEPDILKLLEEEASKNKAQKS